MIEEINIYEVNSLLFQIISSISEADRRKLQAGLTAKLSDSRNGKDLSSLITSISEAQRCKLLVKLSKWYHSKDSRIRGHSKRLKFRGYPRKACIILIKLSINGFTSKCFARDISNSGVFIQTEFSFHVGQNISMILSPPDIRNDITIDGKISRVDSKGIGVEFDRFLDELYPTYTQKLRLRHSNSIKN